MKGLGYGKNYQYAHDTEAKVADMRCLPDSLRDRVSVSYTHLDVYKRQGFLSQMDCDLPAWIRFQGCSL